MSNSKEIIRAGLQKYFEEEPPLVFFWELLYLCPYHCSYCYLGSKLNDPKYIKYPGLVRIVNTLKALNRRITLILLGGEPTLHPDYIAIVKYILDNLGDRLDELLTISNNFRPVTYYSSFINQVGIQHPWFNKLSFDFSFHQEFATFDHFESTIKFLVNHKISCGVRLMAHPLKFDEFKDVHYRFIDMKDMMVYKVRPLMETPYSQPFAAFLRSNCSCDEFNDEIFIKEFMDGSSQIISKNDFRIDMNNVFTGLQCQLFYHWSINNIGQLQTICGNPNNLINSYLIDTTLPAKINNRIGKWTVCEKPKCYMLDVAVLPKVRCGLEKTVLWASNL